MENNTYETILKRRTIRAFKQTPIPKKAIDMALNAARLAPSAANYQFLEYLVIDDKSLQDKIFPNLRWAGYVKPKRDPGPNQRPRLYIAVLSNSQKSPKCNPRDIGAAVENLTLTFLSFGIGCCWVVAFEEDVIRQIFGIADYYMVDSIIAVGYPDESPILETDSENIKYWLDENNQLHVPKRPLSDIVHLNKIKD
tara:strand:+ start:255 stop:842 length:588 start_codon:yes stop_codon:yes gene_type:complete